MAKTAMKTAGATPATKPSTGLMKPVHPSKELAAIVGADAAPRTEIVAKVWAYIKEHKLQDEADKRTIVADAKLKAVFGQDKATMFEMNKLLSPHLKG